MLEKHDRRQDEKALPDPGRNGAVCPVKDENHIDIGRFYLAATRGALHALGRSAPEGLLEDLLLMLK